MLAETAHNAGVITNEEFAIFQNAGYIGLYGGLDVDDILILMMSSSLVLLHFKGQLRFESTSCIKFTIRIDVLMFFDNILSSATKYGRTVALIALCGGAGYMLGKDIHKAKKQLS